MNIKIRNFRIFKKRTGFDIRPLTIFTGPNNAGKSALAKLFMLLKNNIYKLDFTKGIHRIPNFEKAVSFDSKDKYFVLGIDTDIRFFSKVSNAFFYFEDKLQVIKTYLNNDEIFSADTHNYFLNISFNYQKIIDVFLAREYLIPIEYDLRSNPIKFEYAKNCKIDFWNYPHINFSNYREVKCPAYKNVIPKKIEVLSVKDWTTMSIEEIIDYDELLTGNALYNETEKLILDETPYALFDIFKNGEKITQQFYNKILEIQGDQFKLLNVDEGLTSNFNSLFYESLERMSQKIKEFLSSEFSNEKFEIKSSISQNLIFREDYIRWLNPVGGVTLLSEITGKIGPMQEMIRKSEFVTINRGLQFREIDNPNYDLLMRYVQYKNEDKGKFIRNALEILGFSSDIVINQVNLLNGIGIADLLLETEKGRQNLQDLGYGFSMLLPILIQIELGGSPIFIEEPEANLHPNYQSKLADIFLLANEMFPENKIILETHSEYLVRRLQYLIASGKASSKSSIIYYFNSDENVNENNPKVLPIEILPNGTMTEEFGPGFYDEASRLRFDLLKLDDNSAN